MRIQPQKILCAIDFSDGTSAILSYGKSLAHEFGSTLCLCHVVQGAIMLSSHMSPYIDYAGIDSQNVDHARERLEAIAKTLDTPCEIHISTGHPADEIEQIAREKQVDLVIAATYGGSGVKRFLIGSVTSRLVKVLSCPLLVLHPGQARFSKQVTDHIKLKRILVGCDFSEDSRLAFDYGLSLAQEFQTQLYLAHVVSPLESGDLTGTGYLKIQEGDYLGWTRTEYLALQEKAASFQSQKRASLISRLDHQLSLMVPEESRNWCVPVTILLEGEPYQELISYAKNQDIDMIVLGIRGHNLLEQFLVGSTTDRVISRAPCPVLAVRQTDYPPLTKGDTAC